MLPDVHDRLEVMRLAAELGALLSGKVHPIRPQVVAAESR